jgi:AraC-like DNA-binding protein
VSAGKAMTLRILSKDNVTYWIGIPAYPVNLFVDYFMVCDGLPTFKEEYIFPNNNAEIFFNLGDVNYGITGEKNSTFVFRETIVSGLRSERLTVIPGKHFSLAGVRFKLFAFQNVFGIPSDEFTDKNFDATEVWNRNLLDLREQLVTAASPEIKAAMLENWISAKIQLENLYQARCWNKLAPKLVQTSLPLQTYLADLTGYSHKHTVKLFKEKCGLPPKMIQRVFRFNSVLLRARDAGMNWTELSYAAGYADQSHFIKEFKQFTGFTPQLFLKQRPKAWTLLKESR